jgi:uncharacterized protein YjbI with pentapeptide repeats
MPIVWPIVLYVAAMATCVYGLVWLLNRYVALPKSHLLLVFWAVLWSVQIVISRYWPLFSLVTLSLAVLVFFMLAWRPVFQNQVALSYLCCLVLLEMLSFGLMFHNIYQLQGKTAYRIAAEANVVSLAVFALEHLFRAVDIIDAIEGYRIGFYNLKAVGEVSRFYVVCFHCFVDIYFFYAVFKIYRSFHFDWRWCKSRWVWVTTLGGLMLASALVHIVLLQTLCVNVALFVLAWVALEKITQKYSFNRFLTILCLLLAFLLLWLLWLMAMGWWLQQQTPLLFKARVPLSSLLWLGLENFLYTLDFLDICKVYEWRLQTFTCNTLVADTFVVFFRAILVVIVIPILNRFLSLLGAAKIKRAEELFEMIRLGGSLRDKALDELRARKLLDMLQESDLLGVDLSKSDLREVNLTRALLNQANLSYANLHKANLYKAIARGAKFGGANLSHANLREANLRDADLSGADLDHAYYDSKTVWPKGFVVAASKAIGPLEANACLRGVDLANAVLDNVDLGSANLSRANLSNARLTGAHLYKANLSRAVCTGCRLAGSDLSNSDLSFSDLSNSDLSGANLGYAELSNANLEQARLDKCQLYKAGLSRANMKNAHLGSANIQFSDLSFSDLSFSDLRKSDLAYANLSGADLTCADLSQAKLTGAKLRGARYNSKTVWPAGFRVAESQAILQEVSMTPPTRGEAWK